MAKGGGCLLTAVGWTGGFVIASMWWMLPFFYRSRISQYLVVVTIYVDAFSVFIIFSVKHVSCFRTKVFVLFISSFILYVFG